MREMNVGRRERKEKEKVIPINYLRAVRETQSFGTCILPQETARPLLSILLPVSVLRPNRLP